MADTALILSTNLSPNVPATIDTAKTSLTDLARLYLVTEVAGQPQVALDAKRRDMHRFLTFYHQPYGHDRPEEWFVSVTNAFLTQSRGARLAQALLVRIDATIRHFARDLSHDHGLRTHMSLAMDCSEPRPVQHLDLGDVIAVPEVGGLHHQNERQAA
jgi:hypothetical protein